MDPPADFLIFGGDLAQLGDPVELQVGNEIISELGIEKHFIPGEHDWYLDMGKTWVNMFGASPWTFDHKGSASSASTRSAGPRTTGPRAA